MADVFGGLPGGPGDPRGADHDGHGAHPVASDADLTGLERAVDGAALWGLELDPRFRVLAATLEPKAAAYPWGEPDDRRVQVLCFPVSTILASLRRPKADGVELLTFSEEQLVDVVAALDGAPVSAPLFGRPEPQPGEWGPRFSLEGRSTAPDGTARTLTLAARADELELDLFARFDDLELRDPAGGELELPG